MDRTQDRSCSGQCAQEQHLCDVLIKRELVPRTSSEISKNISVSVEGKELVAGTA